MSDPGLSTNRLDEILRRTELAFEAEVAAARGELSGLIDQLMRVDACGRSHYPPDALREVMVRANDLRGLALTLRSDPVAEIAHALFELAEAGQRDGRLSPALVAALGRYCLRVAADPQAAERGELHGQMRELLAEARARAAG